MPRPRVLSALIFFPRGGSSHVARSLGRELPGHGWDVTILSGSKRGHGDARAFYRGLDPKIVDFDAPGVPMHPSYEDRDDAPDPVFAKVDDIAFERHVGTWGRALMRSGARQADVLHLHHLTPIHEAAERVAPGVPVVGHLHGTELLMLEDDEHDRWPHLEAWRERMRHWAARCERILSASPAHVGRIRDALGVDPERCVVVPNGFDPETFRPRHVDRLDFWHEHLVRAPRAWRPGRGPGSIAYREDDLRSFAGDGPVLLYVGRFTAVKRLPLLIEAYAAIRPALARPAPLVILGGYPGEWEGEHPIETVERTGAQDVFLAGWHSHAELSGFLSAADVGVLPSVREQFGQVLVEGMACGLPAVAVDAHGPAEIVRPGRTGWLVPPDDGPALGAALAEAVDQPAERARRGAEAAADAHARFTWPALAERVATLYDDIISPST